jgi:hypothetical protein
MIFDEIERVLSITQIFHLNIIEKQISTRILIKLIILLSDLITLKLHSLLLDKFTGEERRIISKMKFQSKITNVYLEQINNIKEFNRISLLCPRMIHFKVKYINYVDINLFLRTIFIEINHNDNYYLRSLSFHSLLSDDQMVEKLDKMIPSRTFFFPFLTCTDLKRCPYHMTFLLQKLKRFMRI